MMQLSMTDSDVRNHAPQPGDPRREPSAPEALLSDEPTIELVIRARSGDRMAVEAILQRCLPSLKRWAHGRLPAATRGHLDTGDLVQAAALHVLGRLHAFEPRHVGAMQAYLRQTVINRIRDEVRRVTRRPVPVELLDEHPSDGTSPLEAAIRAETYQRYRDAPTQLSSKDRQMIVARVEVQWSLCEISARFGLRTVDAARMAVTRALRRLTDRLQS
jgi:RNA polymerase sigma-70 factor (ECF subfamily)